MRPTTDRYGKSKETKSAWCGNCGTRTTNEVCNGEFICHNCGERIVTN